MHIILRMYVQPCVQVHVHVRLMGDVHVCKLHVHVFSILYACVQVHVHVHRSLGPGVIRCEPDF